MYIAHLSKDKLRKQSVLEHLQNTAELSGNFADAFSCREWGYGCGYLHDIGKYSMAFKRRIEDNGPKVDHSSAGAKELYNSDMFLASYCIAGHHSGLMNGGTGDDRTNLKTLIGRMYKKIPDYSAFSDEVETPCFPALNLLPFGKSIFTASFFVRMLFSCLVDADYLDTEAFMNEQPIPRGDYDTIDTLYDRLLNYISPWLQVKETATINGKRSEILKTCLSKGKESKGLYQLTVPTGGGKTISSLAFALEHAKKNKLKRVIYVIPYTSIIDQNAEVFRDILGAKNVLEHHCNVEYENGDELDPMQLASENWDKPIVVTTNVQFFESLFANKSSKCRKLHNLAQSVIVFDEAQMLPTDYLLPCVWAMNEIVYNYQSSIVLCTATQPALEGLFEDIWNCSSSIAKEEQMGIRDICSNIVTNYIFFKRTNIRFCGLIDEEILVNRLIAKKQTLCILNNRKTAQRIFEKLNHKGISGVFHLSTAMYSRHRKRILNIIKERLANHERCILISTSLVEAGVDLDFEAVYRELAGLDSLLQAAGRCNREGKRDKDDCETIVFELMNSKIPNSLGKPIKITREIMRDFKDISMPDAIHEYFRRLFDIEGKKSLDRKEIVKVLENSGYKNLPFEKIANDFQLIEEGKTIAIIIGKEEKAVEIINEIKRGYCTRETMREIGQYTVNVFDIDFNAYHGAGLLEMLQEDLYILRDSKKYTEDTGLLLNVSIGDASFG